MEVLERPTDAVSQDFDLVKAVRELATGPLAELADDIDRRGTYPRSILHRLGELGALKAHMAEPGKPADYGLAIAAMTEVSRVCGATGFMVWCHDVCGVYMEQSGNPALMGKALTDHGNGQTLGATGMSNPMKTFAGIETFLLHAQKVDGGYVVNGTLPWVSPLLWRGSRHCR
jgi:alkylation response protein AidB-like acyl-CoA dehydrogenase